MGAERAFDLRLRLRGLRFFGVEEVAVGGWGVLLDILLGSLAFGVLGRG